MKSEMMDRLTEDVGGYNNAYTADDVTVYFEVIPSNYLESLIWAEADRLSGLNVNDENFKSERDVVKKNSGKEYLPRRTANSSSCFRKSRAAKHPYKRPTIGLIEDLDAASLENVQEVLPQLIIDQTM